MLKILQDVQKLGESAKRAQKKRTGGGSTPARPQGGAAGVGEGRHHGIVKRQDWVPQRATGSLYGGTMGGQTGTKPRDRIQYRIGRAAGGLGGTLRASADDFDSLFNGLPSDQKMAEDKLLGKDERKTGGGEFGRALPGEGEEKPKGELGQSYRDHIVGRGLSKERREKVGEDRLAEKNSARRAKLLGLANDSDEEAPSLEGLKGRTKELTTDEYLALSPRQRAGVDFNTALSLTVADDLKNQDEYTSMSADAKAEHEKAEKQLFGKDGGSDLFAPKTIALLNEVGFRDTSVNLDDYLGLRAAITESDLDLLASAPGKSATARAITGTNQTSGDTLGPQAVSTDRYNYVNSIADAAEQKIDKLLEEGNALMSGFSPALLRSSSEQAVTLGAVEGLDGLAPGFQGGPEDAEMAKYFDGLADKALEGELPDIWNGLKENVFSEEQWGQFVNYVDTRLSNAERYSLPTGEKPDVQYQDPGKLRKLLGMER